MSMMCIFLVSCEYLIATSRPVYKNPSSSSSSTKSNSSGSSSSSTTSGSRSRPTPKPVAPCSEVSEMTLKDLDDPYVRNADDLIKREGTRTARFIKCADISEQAPGLMVEVKQNGRLIGKFYSNKGLHHDIKLDCDSEVQLRVVSAGYDICGFTVTSKLAQLAGGERIGNSTFRNRQETNPNSQERICKAELRETLYPPLKVFNTRATNGFIVETCGRHHIMYFHIKYRIN